MNRAAGLFLALFLAPVAAPAAAVYGLITNGTTGKPQAGVPVSLLKLEAGMVPIGETVTDGNGRFRFNSPPPSGELPYLLRADYRGVAYHAPARAAAPPGAKGGSPDGQDAAAGSDIEVNLEVFDTTNDFSAARMTRHQLIVEPRPAQLLVAETYVLANETSPRKTIVGPENRVFRFTVPEGKVDSMSVLASGPRQLPVRQNTVELGHGEYALEYPLRPGETRIEVNYRLPYSSEFTFRERPRTAGKGWPLQAGEVVIIAPLEGVTLSGEGLASTGRDESQGAAFYKWTSVKPLEFQISGSLPEAGSAEGESGTGGEAEFSTVENPNFVFVERWKILSVLGVALLLGLAHLYRMGAAAKPSGVARR